MSIGDGTVSLLTLSVAVVAVALCSAVVTASIVTTDDPNPATAVEGSLQPSSDVSVVSQELQYSGTNVTAVEITVNNTANSDRTGDINLAIYDDTGTSLTTTTVSGETFTAGSETTVVVAVDETSIENVATVEATVEVTG